MANAICPNPLGLWIIIVGILSTSVFMSIKEQEWLINDTPHGLSFVKKDTWEL